MDNGLAWPDLPLVGREAIHKRLLEGLESAKRGQGRVFLITGERGSGKTRLCACLEGEAEARGFRVATGRAYQAESGVPYGLLSDAFLPLLREEEPETLQLLTRGGGPDLQTLFPTLGPFRSPPVPTVSGAPRELRARALWTLAELLRHLADRAPLFVILDDLHWSGPSSLEAVHLLARQLAEGPAVLVLTLDRLALEQREDASLVRPFLEGHGLTETFALPPLTRQDTGLLVTEAFGVDEEVAADLIQRLHDWTQGNPFFLEETLKALVASGQLYRKAGTWLGWERTGLELPASVREAVGARLRQLSPAARSVAEAAAILGGRAPFDFLRTLSPLGEAELLSMLDLLVSQEILAERLVEGNVVYDFRQTLVRETLLKELGLARARILHGRVAECLEDLVGEEETRLTTVLAYHHLEAGGHATPSAIRRLVAAGHEALHRSGHAEAVRYLEAALDFLDRAPQAPGSGGVPESSGSPGRELGLAGKEPGGDRLDILKALAGALGVLGRHQEAIDRWEEARLLAQSAEAPADAGECALAIARLRNSLGQPRRALVELDGVLASPTVPVPDSVSAQARVYRAIIRSELGQVELASRELGDLLTDEGSPARSAVLAETHRALANIHVWTGHPDRARHHAHAAMELARRQGQRPVEFWSNWDLAVLEGLLGNTREMAGFVREADRIAREIRAPLLRIRSLELEVELSAAIGEWDRGIAQGEQAIAMARTFLERTVLPRVLVWTALIYLNRGDLEVARPLIHEAWEGSGAGGDVPFSVHAAVPAHIGAGYLALAEGDFDEAIRIGREGLAKARKAGYALWTLHRLLPMLAEAHLWKGDVTGAKEIGSILRREAASIGHRVGLALADSCDALVTWLEGDAERGSALMDDAAHALEAIPMVGEAARLRRLRAGRLAEMGDRDGALEELHRVHEVFLRLNARTELDKTRVMFREVGARPPRRAARGGGDLSPRELEIAHLVETGKSNKAIARSLGISHRTVSTHLSNVYQKLDITSRGELADYMRSEGLIAPAVGVDETTTRLRGEEEER